MIEVLIKKSLGKEVRRQAEVGSSFFMSVEPGSLVFNDRIGWHWAIRPVRDPLVVRNET